MKMTISGDLTDLHLPVRTEVLTPIDFRFCRSLNEARMLAAEDPVKHADLAEFLRNGKNHEQTPDGLTRELDPVFRAVVDANLGQLLSLFVLDTVSEVRLQRSNYKEVPYEVRIVRAFPLDPSDAGAAGAG